MPVQPTPQRPGARYPQIEEIVPRSGPRYSEHVGIDRSHLALGGCARDHPLRGGGVPLREAFPLLVVGTSEARPPFPVSDLADLAGEGGQVG
jgi:hypothetical protein